MHERARQPERTALSWFRTVLGFVAVGILALRQPASATAELVTLAVVVPIVVGVGVVATQRSRVLRRSSAAQAAADPSDASITAPAIPALVLTLGVLVVGALALVLAT